jgi:hypothetical protein
MIDQNRQAKSERYYEDSCLTVSVEKQVVLYNWSRTTRSFTPDIASCVIMNRLFVSVRSTVNKSTLQAVLHDKKTEEERQEVAEEIPYIENRC